MKEPSGVSRSFSFTSSLRGNPLTVNRSDITICQTIKTHIRAHLSVCKTDCMSETGLLKLLYTTCLCLPSTILHPVANIWVAQGSCCSWWWTLALWTWEEELDSKREREIREGNANDQDESFLERDLSGIAMHWSVVTSREVLQTQLFQYYDCRNQGCVLGKYSVLSVYQSPKPPTNAHSLSHPCLTEPVKIWGQAQACFQEISLP